MTKKKPASSLFRDTLFLMALIAPLAGAALFLWSNRVKDHLSSFRQTHSIAHNATEGFISRDIDDLEAQLENTTVAIGETFLPGDFRFRKEGNSLKATHTSRPSQPISIELESDLAFAKPLNQVKGQNFVLISSRGEIVSHSAEAKKLAHATIADPKIMNAETNRSLSLSDFESSRIAAISTSQFLFDRPTLLFSRTHVPNSNLTLFSYNDLRPLWKEASTSFFLILAATFAAFALGFAALLFNRSRQTRHQAWLAQFFESLRFGRIDGDYPVGIDRTAHSELYKHVRESLTKNSSLRRFLDADWVDASRSSVSWKYFKNTISHWSEGLSTDTHEAPKRWYIGSCRVKSAEMIELFQRALTHKFGGKTVRIYQSNETEFSFTLRDKGVSEFQESIKGSLRLAAGDGRLTANEFAISIYLISSEIPGEAMKALAETQARCREQYKDNQGTLVETCVELRHYQTKTELSTFGISDAHVERPTLQPKASAMQLRSAAINAETLRTSAGKEAPAFPKRSPVPRAKTRPKLPPPPTALRTKNKGHAGKGFVRIVDALGESAWVEISGKKAPTSTPPTPKPKTPEADG